ncbi:TRAF3-interacting protein 1 [Plodia interpunctella]|uniref:TRAF3-interacting protein 1 n=1 Tax=Plodia interpunctella TaxID=58824 RepID=UPI002367C4A2|nr:TRAF3-interacting protein 1 [Plodia interpunctella]
MEKELDPNIIKATQISLGKYVKRPPLSEKLLKKPPFRFLHDVVTSVLKTTGFFEGLFEPEELISENVKDRESKIKFLNKVITVIGLTTGKQLAIKPSKVVAGQEADKTNELLQTLALALDKKLSSEEAVKKYKESGNVQQISDKKNKEATKLNKEKEKRVVDSKKLISKSSEKLTANKKDPGRVSVKNGGDGKTSTKNSQKDAIKNDIPPKKSTQHVKDTTKEVDEKKESLQQLENIDKNKKVNDITKSSNSNNSLDDEDVNRNSNLPLEEEVSKIDETPEISKNHPQSDFSSTVENQINSSLSSQDLMEIEDDKQSQDELVKNNVNNEKEANIPYNSKSSDDSILSHINLKSNKVKNDSFRNNDNVLEEINSDVDKNTHINSSVDDKNFNNVKNNGVSYIESVPKSPEKTNSVGSARPKSVRPSSSRPGAPRLRDKHDNIITESENLIVGKVNIIAENTPIEEEEDSSIIIEEKKMLHTQNEQEQFQLSSKPHGHLVQQILDSQKEFSQLAGKTEIEWEFGAQKAREAVNKEIEQLRYNIQGLSRVANPLGKILDHIQEDVEVMRQELQQWANTYDEASKELLKQKTLNEDSLFPFRGKVKQLEVDINEKHEKINDLRIVIHKNSTRIEKLLASGDVQY